MPTAQFIQAGDALDYIPAADTLAGSVVVLEDLVAIAKRDIKANQLGAVHTTGVYDVSKETGAGKDVPLGKLLYWDATNQRATKASGGSVKLMGKCAKAATEGDTTVQVRLS